MGFVSGGVVSQSDHTHGCIGAAGAGSSGDNHAAFVLHRSAFGHTSGAGWGSPGAWCYDSNSFFWCHDESTFPQNSRYALVDMSADGQLSLLAVIHEMGHAAGLPHSFTGLLALSHPYREYDNFMDIMSGGSNLAVMGTPAVNRYAGGLVRNPNRSLFMRVALFGLCCQQTGFPRTVPKWLLCPPKLPECG